jgi:sulfite reductase (ferredoxin)
MSRTPLSTFPIKTEPLSPAIAEEIETFEAEAIRMVSGDVSGDL